MTRVKSYYKVVFSGREWKEVRKRYSHLPKELTVDIDDRDQLVYMFRNCLTKHGVKLYLVYSDGTKLRIRAHRCIFGDRIRRRFIPTFKKR